MRAEIQQDVDRCMPENMYFHEPATQRMMLDILFIFCKLNPDIGYRQGMHELLAPILWVVDRDAIDLGQSSKAMGEDALIKAVYDSEHIEHDAFALFGQVMQSAKNFYEQTTHTAAENPIVSRSKRIVSEMLPQVDVELAQHLEKIDIVPQVFLMRWIRLLFGREFPFDDMLTMWDAIFAEDASLEIVNHICVAMLLRVRWDLLDTDYNGALTLLLRYPTPDEDLMPQTLVTDALYLREHMHAEGGSFLVLKYTGRPLQPAGRPVTPPALQRNITAFSGVNAAKAALSRPGLSPTSRPRQGRNIEAILQSTAKNIYARSESFGINKTIRSAVDEVHRKAQEIRDTQTPSPPATWRQRQPRTAQGFAMSRVKELEARNAQLSKLLEGAVGELWEYQKLAAETKPATEGSTQAGSGSDLEKLSVAIAKVQFVNVYLGDSSLPLPAEETAEESASLETAKAEPAPSLQAPPLEEKEAVPPASPTPQKPVSEAPAQPSQGASDNQLADPSTFDDYEEDVSSRPALLPHEPKAPDNKASNTADSPPASATPAPKTHLSPTSAPAPNRPPLAESSYSWMLGQDTPPSDARKPSPGFFEDQRRNRGFLFGDEDASAGTDTAARQKKGHRKTASKGEKVDEDGGEEVFDMGSLRRNRPL